MYNLGLLTKVSRYEIKYRAELTIHVEIVDNRDTNAKLHAGRILQLLSAQILLSIPRLCFSRIHLNFHPGRLPGISIENNTTVMKKMNKNDPPRASRIPNRRVFNAEQQLVIHSLFLSLSLPTLRNLLRNELLIHRDREDLASSRTRGATPRVFQDF